MTKDDLAVALFFLGDAKRSVSQVAKFLTADGETDEAALKTIAVLDAIDRARHEIQLRERATAE